MNEDNGKAWGLFIQYIWKFTINMRFHYIFTTYARGKYLLTLVTMS